MNLLQLADNSKELATWREFGYGQNQQFKLNNVIPFQGVKTLLVQSTCYGETVSAEHVQNLNFLRVKYLNELPKDGSPENVKTKEYGGSDYYFIKPTLSTDVLMRCSCPDWVYRSSYFAWKEKCIFGSKPKAYKRKTTGKRKPMNPIEKPFLCKHLTQLVQFLQAEGWIQ